MKFFIFLIIFVHRMCLTYQRSYDHFFPFGLSNGDLSVPKADDSFVGPIDIATKFPFFNSTFSSLYVNTNGLISFKREVVTFVPQRFPLKDVIGVAPFWADVDITNGGDIFYREITDNNVLSKISADIRQQFLSMINFRTTWAFIVTWNEVAAFGSRNNRVNNTFQAVVATNGKHSFTIFNYGNIGWTLGDFSNGTHAQSGFNAGDSKTFFILPGSFSQSVVNLTRLSNMNEPGKWIFRVDTAEISEGGCNDGGFLTPKPSKVFFIGSDHILVEGPCFDDNNEYTIKYDDNEELVKNCVVVDSTKSVCPIPFLNRIGRIPISISNGGDNNFEGFIFTQDISLEAQIKGIEYYYKLDELPEVNITWVMSGKKLDDLTDISYSINYLHVNEVSNESFALVLNENGNQNGTLVDLSLIEQERYFSEMPLAFIGVKRKSYFKKGNEAIDYHNYIALRPVFIISPLDSDPADNCNEWYNEQPNPIPLINGSTPCWRVAPNNQLNGFGQFRPDASCNTQNSESCNIFHPGAKACFRSVSEFNGAGQQCCYSQNNVLLVGPTGGASLDFTHPNNVLEHFQNDIRPYFWCCKLSNKCGSYYEKRPSDDGSRWIPPMNGNGQGDPHFRTLDGLEFTFNGYGEYIFLQIEKPKFSVQVRMAPYKDERGRQMDATVFTAIAIKGENIDSLQLELNEEKKIDIFINGIFYKNEEETFTDLELNGVYLYLSSDRYTLQFSNGINIGVQLTEEKDALSFITSVPRTFKGKIKGLLGNMDDDPFNDFMLPNGTDLFLDSSDDRAIFEEYGQHWRTTNINSCFTYFNGFSHASYMNATFKPKFLSDGVTFANKTLESLAKLKCGDNEYCLFDVSTTGKLSIGYTSVQFEKEIQEIKKFYAEAAKTCVPLSSVFQNGAVERREIVNGYEYKFTCNQGFCLEGKSTIKCENSIYNFDQPVCSVCSSGIIFKSNVWLIFLYTLVAFFIKFY